MNGSIRGRLAYLLLRGTPGFVGMRTKMDVRNVNGGVFLGLEGIVIKSHGGTDAVGMARAIDLGYAMVRDELLGKIPRHARAGLGRPAHQRACGPFPSAGPRGHQDKRHVTDKLSGPLRSVVVGVGSFLPANVVTNKQLEERVATSDEWIVQRTGITRRHIAAADETTSTIGLKAARAALDNAGLTSADIDLVIVATSTPDYTFPSVATQIQAGLGMTHGAAFDVQAVCSGFVFAVATADKFLVSGSHKRALVVGAETFSRLLDWEDRTTCVLFGDGAAALVFEARPGTGDVADRGVLTSHLRSDGRHRSKLYVDGGPSSTQTTGHLRMAGKEVFRHAVGMVTDVIEDAFTATGISAADLDWFVPHQANRRIIDASADKLGIGREKVVVTVDLHANTSAASIPLALSVACADGRIKTGDLVMIEAMGGGFTWGSALIRW